MKNYLIIGAGVSGLSVVEYFYGQNKNFRIMDTRDLPPNAAKIKSILPSARISFGGINQQWIDKADVIVLSPGISPQMPELRAARATGTEIIGDIELFARYVTKPYIAITGSNGKSTVTMLVKEILARQGLKVKACANIGDPALSVINDDVDVFVLELSSFQLETCKNLLPSSSVVLNISDDHLDRHGSIDQYAHIKSTIYNNAQLKIFPRDKHTKKYLSKHHSDLSFGLDAPEETHYGILDDESGRWLALGSKKIIRSSELSLLGSTGELNALAALALTQKFIINEAEALKALTHFKGLEHRCELVTEHQNIKWIDDSKGTNVGATVSAIEGFNCRIVLILGGVYKGGSLADLNVAVKKHVSHVIVFGQDRQIFVDALNENADVSVANTLDDCVEMAAKFAQPGQVVLFSPACASFDMFSNYIERGLAFKTAVLAKMDEDSDG